MIELPPGPDGMFSNVPVRAALPQDPLAQGPCGNVSGSRIFAIGKPALCKTRSNSNRRKDQQGMY